MKKSPKDGDNGDHIDSTRRVDQDGSDVISKEFSDIWRSAWMGDVAALQTFLARSELMQGDSKGNTGTFALFYELLSIKKYHSIGYPALVHAAGYGKIKAFCLLLSATPLWPMEQLRRSLTQASRYGHCEIVGEILRHLEMERDIGEICEWTVS